MSREHKHTRQKLAHKRQQEKRRRYRDSMPEELKEAQL